MPKLSKMPELRTLKRCLLCGIEYHNGVRAPKNSECPRCGEPEVEHIQFEYLFQQVPYDKDDILPSCPDEGCDVVTAYIGGMSKCLNCPLFSCLDFLHHKWYFYSKNKELVLQVWKFMDDGMLIDDIADKLNIHTSSVHKIQGDRNVIQPIYEKLKGKHLTLLKGPKQ